MSEVLVEVDGRRLRLTNLSKVMYPATGTTKGEVLNYYAQAAPVLLPHLAGRAVTRIRWPNGTAGNAFFEKNAPAGAPDWLRTVTIASTGSRGGGDSIEFPIIDSLAALTYLVNLGSLELHVHQWRVDRDDTVRNPDRMVIDLDPGPGASLHECCQVALEVKERLDALGLRSVPVTSGSKGLHLYTALPGRLDADAVREQAQGIAQELTRKLPQLVVWRMTKALRPGKVLLDWSQNTRAKTTITPYSLRGKEAPQVAMPRTWAEVEGGADHPQGLGQCTMGAALTRVAADGDVFATVLQDRG